MPDEDSGDAARADRVRMRAALLAWYGPRARTYPWRRGPNPYRTLVSEVMLQQTQASRAAPAFERFVARFPDVATLAAAARADVLRAWDGLGYNRRAVALSEAARTIVRDHGGRVPSDPSVLRSLPGVGPYTAVAVASIGHGRPVAAVDVNVRRVVARAVLGVRDAMEGAAAVGAADGLLDRTRPSEWNQAVMDLGREVCRPVPRCSACPIATWCAWRLAHPNGDDSAARPASSRQGRFEGSFRQVRGGVLRVLRHSSGTVADIALALGRANAEVDRAVAALMAEGAVEQGPGTTVRLAESASAHDVTRA